MFTHLTQHTGLPELGKTEVQDPREGDDDEELNHDEDERAAKEKQGHDQLAVSSVCSKLERVG